MWSLLKAEIQYNTPIFWYVIICSVLGFLAIHLMPVITGEVPGNQNSGTIFLSLMVAYFVMSMLTNPWGKEKRTRQFVKLPVSLLHTRLAHFLLHLLFWIILVLFFLLFTQVSKYFVLDSAIFLVICVQTGLALFIYALFGFFNCFTDSVWRKSVEIISLLVFLFISITVAFDKG